VALAGLSLIPGIMAGQALERGRDAVEKGRGALLAFDAGPRAAESFVVAQAAFQEAARWAENPLVRFDGLIPILGRTPDAVGRLARAGERIATAGSVLSRSVSTVPGGLAGLAPRRGQLPLDTIKTLAPAVASARAELEASYQEIRPISTSLVVPPVGAATTLVRTELDEALRLIRSADAILTGLPDLAGVKGKRRYFIAAQNPAEIRGTGGIIGMYSIMTLDRGRIDFGPFLDRLPPDLDPGDVKPPRGVVPPYTQFNPATFWLNINTTPDAPTSARMIEKLWRKVEKQPLDGVIFVTPQALSPLLTALGPVEIPKLDYTVTSENVVDFTTNKAYFLFKNRGFIRNRVLGLVTEVVLNRFFAANRPEPAVKALVDAASRGLIVIHSADRSVQKAFAEAGIDGDFAPGAGDFFSLVANSMSRNKVDFYVKRTVDYRVDLQPGGWAIADATVTLKNTAPSRKTFNEALGPIGSFRGTRGLRLESGEDFTFLSFYCAASCSSREAAGRTTSMDGLTGYSQADARMFGTSVRLKSKKSQTFDLAFRTSNAWSGDDVGGVYRLRLRDQPVVKPTEARVSMRLPPGMRILSVNVPITLEGDRLVWQGDLGEIQDIEIRFERPLLEKLWTRAWDFLTRPVVRIG
jgi:hypothetical protein